MGPRPGAVRSVCLRRIVNEAHLNEVKRDIEMRKVNEVRLWQFRRKPNSANVLNGHLIFAPVDSPEHREVWRRSWIEMEKYRTARTLREFWDGSPFGIGKWPHMLPVVPTRVYRKTIRLLKALHRDSPIRMSMTEIQDDVNQDVNVNQTDPQEDAPPMVAKTDPVDDWRAVDLDEDGFLDRSLPVMFRPL